MLNNLFGKPKSQEDQIKDLEEQAQQDQEQLSKTQRIAQLRQDHINAQKKIKQYRQNNMNRLIFGGVLVFVVFVFLFSRC